MSSPFASLQFIEFRNYITGRFFFIMGLRMTGTLVGWWMYELTGNPLALGLIGLSEVIPALSLALYAGHVIDRTDKRFMLRLTVALYALCSLCLLTLSTDFVKEGLGKNFVIISIYAVIFFTGAVRAFSGPTFSSLIANLVPREMLPNAITWNSGTWLTASVAGHASAGFLIAGIGITGTLVVILCLILTAFLALSYIKSKPPLAVNANTKTWESMKEGLRFVFRTPEILGALTLDLFAVLFGGAVALVPVYAKDILNVGAIGFGWLNAAADIGAVTVIILMTLFPIKRKQGKILLFAVGGFGISIMLFGISEIYWLSFLALMMVGVLDGISVIIRGTILQMRTPDAMRGRVMSVNSMFINSSNELGQFESGVTAKLFGVVPSVLFGGAMTLMVVIVTWFKAPSLRKLEY